MENAHKTLSVKQNMVWNTVGCLIYQGCLWAITILVVTLSGYTNSGYLAFAMAIGNIFFPIASYNIRTFQVSDVKNEFSQGNYVAFRFITIVIALIIIITYLLFSASSSELIYATLAWLVFKTDEAFCNVYYGIDQKNGRMDYIGISQLIRGICLISSFSLILFFTQNINLAIIVMSALCILITFLYDRKKAISLTNAKASISKQRAMKLLKKCLPSMLTLLCYASTSSIARQIYEIQDGTYLLGIYAAIATPTVLIQVAASYLYSPFIEPLSKALFEKRFSYIRSVITKIFLGIIAICFLLFITAYFWGTDFLVFVFGDSIKDYSFVLPYTVLVAASIAAMGFFIEIMIIYRHLLIALASNVIALITSAITTIYLVPVFGMNGLNASLTISCIFAILIGCAMFFVKAKESKI